MDLVVGPARWLAGPLGRVLGVEGRTPQERRDEVLNDITLPGDDVDELALRHYARMAAWLVIFIVTFLPSLAAATFILVFAEGIKDPAFLVMELLNFSILFMFCVHGLKALIAHYMPERWWNPRSRVWRVVMLAQVPEIVVAVAAAVATSPSLG